MFKLLFRTISVITFITLLLVAVAIWKGGAPFRAAGERTIALGTAIVQLADLIDDVLDRKEEVHESVKQLRETLEGVKGITGEDETTGKRENGSVHPDEKPE